MTESLWNAVDNYLAAQILADMGNAGSYTTLQLASVEKWAQFDVVDFRDMTLPFGIVMSYRGDSEPAGHSGESRLQTKESYTVAICVVCDGTKAAATADAKTLVWRLKKFLRGLRITDLSADDGSKADRIVRGAGQMFTTQIDLWAKPSSRNADSVYGTGVVGFAVSGTTT